MRNAIIHVISLFVSLITYARIRRKLGIGKDELAIICPYGIGDTYFVCILSSILAQKHNRSIVLVVKQYHLPMTRMFTDSISRAIPYELTATELRRVGDATTLLNGNLLVGHPSSIRKQFLFEMVGIESLNLLDCYKVYFDLPLQCQITLPRPENRASRKARELMESLHLPEGRTALLCPACYSTEKMPVDFWRDLAQSLRKAGFTVCTNVAGLESCIEGTIPLTAELDLLIPLVERAGHVVSARSGLCDLISSAACKKFFVYPDQRWAHGTIFSGTSLVRMGLATDVREYVYAAANKKHLIGEILSHLHPVSPGAYTTAS